MSSWIVSIEQFLGNKNSNMSNFKTEKNYKSDTIIHMFIYYQLMIMNMELVS